MNNRTYIYKHYIQIPTMKINLLACFLLISTISFAQVPTSATVNDCNNNVKDISSTLATGKALIIASEGFDCSICVNAAPALQSWAANNKSKVAVWAAMTYSNQQPNCSNLSTWKSTHSWNDIFMFIDSTKQWFVNGTPKYYVYNPSNGSIIYSGSNATTAQNMALNTSLITSLNNNNLLINSKIYFNRNEIIIENIPKNSNRIEVYNLKGKLLSEVIILNEMKQVEIPIYQTKGIIFIRFINNNNEISSKKFFIQ